MNRILVLTFTYLALSCSHSKVKEMDINKDGTITEQEWHEFYNSEFKQKDKNNDGKVTAKEMTESSLNCHHGKSKKHGHSHH